MRFIGKTDCKVQAISK